MYNNQLCYVYALCDPRKPLNDARGLPYEPFYIGKGKGRRAFRHFNRSTGYELTYNPYKAKKIAKIKAETKRDAVIVFIDWDLSEADAYELEVRQIALWGRVYRDPGGVLVNISAGGPDGGLVHARSPAAKAKASAARAGRPLSDAAKELIRQKALGRKHTPETCEKIRAIRLSTTHVVSEETRRKLRDLHLGKAKPGDFGEKIRRAKLGKPRPDIRDRLSKQLSMYTMEGRRLGTNASAREAMAATTVHFKAISSCCTGRSASVAWDSERVTFRFGSAERIEVAPIKKGGRPRASQKAA